MIIRSPYTRVFYLLEVDYIFPYSHGVPHPKPQEFFPPVIDATERYAVRDESSGVMACKAPAVAA